MAQAKRNSSKTAGESKITRYTRMWFTGASLLLIILIVMAGSAWFGTRLFMESGLTWWEGAPVPVTMDLMMITAGFHLRKPGATPTAQDIARKAMRFGLLTSLVINVASAVLHSKSIELVISMVTGEPVQVMAVVKAIVLISASWIPTWVLKHLVDVLTVTSSREAHAGDVKAPKASEADEARKLARRIADQARRTKAAEIKKLEAQVSL